MVDLPRYIAALATKRGEVNGFADVAPNLQGSIAPLWTVAKVSLTDEDQKKGVSLPKKISNRLRSLADTDGLPRQGRRWIDACFVEDDPRLVVDALWNNIQLDITGTLQPTPVTGPERTMAQQDLAAGIAREWPESGLGLRLRSQYITTSSAEDVKDLVSRCQVPAESIDLFVDLAAIKDADEALIRAQEAIGALGGLRPWRSIVLLAGSFPAGAQGLAQREINVVPRAEWRLWSEIFGRLHEAYPNLVYGDYSVVHPDAASLVIDYRVPRVAKVRYTAETEFLITRGTDTIENGREQLRDLARLIEKDERFRGPDFSAGEKYIAACAQGPGETGVAEAWIRAGHTQHLTYMTTRLAAS